MDEQAREDIRRLLRSFGVQADKAMSAYLEDNPDVTELRVRIRLQGERDAGAEYSPPPLDLVVGGIIRRGVGEDPPGE